MFASFMASEEIQCFSYQLDVLLITGNDKGVEDLFPVLCQWLVFFILGLLGATDYPAILYQKHEVYETEC